MTFQQRLMDEIKEAMKAKAAERLGALRLILNALKDREINARGAETAGVAGAAVSFSGGIDPALAGVGGYSGGSDGKPTGLELGVLAKMVKQRQDSVKAYLDVGRSDLAAKESAEIAVIEEFLPQQLGAAEVEAAVASAIAEVGASSLKDMGKVMTVLKAKYTGQMDFGAVGALIKGKL